MFDEKIEIGSNFYSLHLDDINSINYVDIENLLKENSVKLQIELNDLDSLKRFEESKILELYNIHISINCSKQIFLIMNIPKIINKGIFKSIEYHEKRINFEIYLTDNISQSNIENNMKIIDRIRYMINDVQIHSKSYEILYQAKLLLRELKKTKKN